MDCWRIYPEGMRALSDDAGLDVELSEWGSLEMQRLEKRIPQRIRKQQVFQRLSGVVGMRNAAVKVPVEAAYDTITVARKRG